MAEFRCRRGDFVDCFFPFAEHPALPGPISHIVYFQSLVRLRNGELRGLVMLTTTSPRMIRLIPSGLSVSISATDSRRMGMHNAFVIDIHRMALLPPDIQWFPDINSGQFVIGRADERLRTAITRRYDELRRLYPNPALILGPSSPT